MTFKEMREMQRNNEVAHLGPGTHHEEKPFAAGVKGRVDMGSKYKFVPKEGPAPGQYDPTKGMKLTKPKEYEAFIMGEEKSKDGVLLDGSRPSREGGNDPGKYDGHLKPIGSDLKRVDFGSPYKFVPKEGPAPGQYEDASNFTKPKVPAVIIREDLVPEKRAKEQTPAPGSYDGHL